ncbi:hypothetical protein [Tumebacillus permanentifrigoris]|uniref:Uncharacterized protein n=1 Tax=Tumebacillus permanentifrigoris TaxID=378543 RepID=A0A316DAF0_9BACL|nr:hypothetical protein [Tumebacillus permanentifrigoris]PWK13471.1 hypothetical protein C7459_107139 [Tumebacillus permanentifrigoris]
MFIPSQEKMLITSNDDFLLLKELRNELDRNLVYMGLPGPLINDLLTWSEVLSDCICFEKNEKEKDQIIRSLYISELTKRLRFKVICADVEEYLINRMQYYDTPTFDLVNLDYFGPPIVLTKDGSSNRVSSWEKLFTFQTERKRSEPFVLFITTSVRNKDEGEIDKMLEDMKHEAPDILIPHNAPGYEHLKMKLLIPYLLRSAASREKWDLELKYCHTYLSKTSRMVHFAFRAEPSQSRLVTRHKQSLIDISNLDMLDITSNYSD